MATIQVNAKNTKITPDMTGIAVQAGFTRVLSPPPCRHDDKGVPSLSPRGETTSVEHVVDGGYFWQIATVKAPVE